MRVCLFDCFNIVFVSYYLFIPYQSHMERILFTNVKNQRFRPSLEADIDIMFLFRFFFPPGWLARFAQRVDSVPVSFRFSIAMLPRLDIASPPRRLHLHSSEAPAVKRNESLRRSLLAFMPGDRYDGCFDFTHGRRCPSQL